jgi:hypothetical protein
VLTEDASADEASALIARASKVTYDYLGAH